MQKNLGKRKDRPHGLSRAPAITRREEALSDVLHANERAGSRHHAEQIALGGAGSGTYCWQGDTGGNSWSDIRASLRSSQDTSPSHPRAISTAGEEQTPPPEVRQS